MIWPFDELSTSHRLKGDAWFSLAWLLRWLGNSGTHSYMYSPVILWSWFCTAFVVVFFKPANSIWGQTGLTSLNEASLNGPRTWMFYWSNCAIKTIVQKLIKFARARYFVRDITLRALSAATNLHQRHSGPTLANFSAGTSRGSGSWKCMRRFPS